MRKLDIFILLYIKLFNGFKLYFKFAFRNYNVGRVIGGSTGGLNVESLLFKFLSVTDVQNDKVVDLKDKFNNQIISLLLFYLNYNAWEAVIDFYMLKNVLNLNNVSHFPLLVWSDIQLATAIQHAKLLRINNFNDGFIPRVNFRPTRKMMYNFSCCLRIVKPHTMPAYAFNNLSVNNFSSTCFPSDTSKSYVYYLIYVTI